MSMTPWWLCYGRIFRDFTIGDNVLLLQIVDKAFYEMLMKKLASQRVYPGGSRGQQGKYLIFQRFDMKLTYITSTLNDFLLRSHVHCELFLKSFFIFFFPSKEKSSSPFQCHFLLSSFLSMSVSSWFPFPTTTAVIIECIQISLFSITSLMIDNRW